MELSCGRLSKYKRHSWACAREVLSRPLLGVWWLCWGLLVYVFPSTLPEHLARPGLWEGFLWAAVPGAVCLYFALWHVNLGKAVNSFVATCLHVSSSIPLKLQTQASLIGVWWLYPIFQRSATRCLCPTRKEPEEPSVPVPSTWHTGRTRKIGRAHV